MSELIWKIKQLFRKIVPIALIVGICYGGFTAYKKGYFGRTITHRISTLTQKIPFFGSKFSFKSLSPGNLVGEAPRVSHVTRRKGHHRTHGRRHHSRRRHRSHR
jgi:hypothetical protein